LRLSGTAVLSSESAYEEHDKGDDALEQFDWKTLLSDEIVGGFSTFFTELVVDIESFDKLVSLFIACWDDEVDKLVIGDSNVGSWFMVRSLRKISSNVS